MTNQQISCAIAEACGFKLLRSYTCKASGKVFRMWDYPKTWNGPKSDPWTPEFCSDLNAMHEAEKIFCNCSIRREYADEVALACDANWRYDAIHASARQRAEAFLRTLGKWEDGK